jgi:hypothetical protein
MIDYGAVVTQIRTVIPDTFKAVSGGVSVESLDVTANTGLPAAFVIPLSMSFEQGNIIHGGGMKQYGTEHFGVVVIMDTGDLRGQAAALLVPNFRKKIWSAILNWHNDTTYAVQGIYYEGDEFMTYDSGRTWWLFKFALDLQISYLDGFIPPSVPLTTISPSVGPYDPPVTDSNPEALIIKITGLDDDV